MAVLTKPAIVKTPEVCFGKPRIDGTRISVDLVLRLANDGRSNGDIVAMYPHLTEAQVQAALDYAKENPAEMEAIEKRFAEFLKKQGLPNNWW